MIKKNLITLAAVGGFLTLLFSAGRIGFLIYHREYFTEFPWSEILLSLLAGIRFDLVVIAQTMGVICFCLFLLGNWSHNRWINRLFYLLTLLVLIFYISIYVADLGYYPIIKRHLSFEVPLVFHDLPGAFRQAVSGYLLLIILYFVFVGLLAFGWHKFWHRLRSIPDHRSGLLKHLVTIPVVFLCLAIIGRGGFQSKPTDENFAYRNQHVQLGNLTLNAPYTVGVSMARDRVKKLDLLDTRQATTEVRNLVKIPGDTFLDPEYPLLRQSVSHSPYTRPLSNIVIIVMEGVPALWTGSFNASLPVSDTPQIDQIAARGLKFTRFFGAGRYTTQGFSALISSIPALPSITLINSPFVQNSMLSIPRALKKLDYDMLFLSGYFEGSASIDSFMKSMGIQKTLNQSDFADFEKISHGWGVYDEYVFDRFYDEIKQMREPFLAIVEPCTTHSPHAVPDKKWLTFDRNVPDGPWRNVLRYSDWTIGEFFKKAATLDTYKNTLFVITSDHVSETKPNHYADSARLPLIFYTPGGQIPPGENDMIGSQTDLLPTVLDYLGLNPTHASAGKSLLSGDRNTGFAMHYNGSFILWFQDDMVTRYTNLEADSRYNLTTDWMNRQNIIQKNPRPDIDTAFLSYLQTTQNGILNNRIYR
ncbi:sulfatase-like hydrolase/transferase [bacterium]|nr:sulfatase-like hydrolase/transferase [bacterium]